MLDRCRQLELMVKLCIIQLAKQSRQNLIFVVCHSRTSRFDWRRSEMLCVIYQRDLRQYVITMHATKAIAISKMLRVESKRDSALEREA